MATGYLAPPMESTSRGGPNNEEMKFEHLFPRFLQVYKVLKGKMIYFTWVCVDQEKRVLWNEQGPSPNSYLEALTPDVTVLGELIEGRT